MRQRRLLFPKGCLWGMLCSAFLWAIILWLIFK